MARLDEGMEMAGDRDGHNEKICRRPKGVKKIKK